MKVCIKRSGQRCLVLCSAVGTPVSEWLVVLHRKRNMCRAGMETMCILSKRKVGLAEPKNAEGLARYGRDLRILQHIFLGQTYLLIHTPLDLAIMFHISCNEAIYAITSSHCCGQLQELYSWKTWAECCIGCCLSFCQPLRSSHQKSLVGNPDSGIEPW